MADKNNKENPNSKKRYKFIGIFLIVLLLLFIGVAGYYLERDLEPVPDDQLKQSQELEEDKSSPAEKSSEIKEKEAQPQDDQSTAKQITDQEDDQSAGEQITEGKTEAQLSQDSEAAEEQLKDTDKKETADLEKEVNKKIEEKDTKADLDQESEFEEESSDLSQEKMESETQKKEQQLTDGEKEEEEFLQKELDKKETTTEASEESSEIEKKDEKTDEDNLNEQSIDDKQIKAEEKTDREESGTEISEEGIDQKEAAEKENQKESKEIKDVQQENDNLRETDNEQAVESSQGQDSQKSEDSKLSEQGSFEKELEDSSLLDKILSILGLSDSDFSQNLNILFVGLDDEESVALGTVEADSIMIGKLRPEENSLKIKKIDEDTVYKNQLLREYHDGDVKKAVEEITDIKLDYHVYINYQGFESVIDELGGVQIYLDQAVEVPALGLNLKEGNNLLSGKEALNFIRWKGSDEISRFERQKLLINSVLNKLRGNNILFDIKELYNTIVESYNSIKTDINPVLAAEIFNYVKGNEKFRIEFSE